MVTSTMSNNQTGSQLSYQDQTEAANQNKALETNSETANSAPLESSYAVGYQEALTLKLSGRHAKFFADAFANEYDTAKANHLSTDQAIAYATDFAGPYALAFMAFLEENAEVLTANKLLSQAQNFALTHIASYEEPFKKIQHDVLDLQAKKEQAAEKIRLEQVFAHEQHVKEQRKIAKDEGYRNGYSDGKKTGETEHYDRGYKKGQLIGHEEGLSEGFKAAISKDYDDGLQTGKVEAYKRTALIGLPLIIMLALISYGASLYY